VILMQFIASLIIWSM